MSVARRPFNLARARVLILGGTGTLGQALTERLFREYPEINITVLSRSEHKQAEMKRRYPRARYVLGDIRDFESISPHFLGIDVVFHVAALKHVDILEDNTFECINTNVLGTRNAADAAMTYRVKYFVFSSTDKAVDPINTYGYSKALSEKLLYQYNRHNYSTKFSVYRWGNVLGSQGSAIPLFAESILINGTANVTSLEMTRFWLPISWAVDYMLRTFAEAKRDAAMIPPVMKTASTVEVIQAVAKILNKPVELKVTGIRPGEKIHEVMTSQHSSQELSSETHTRFSERELIDLLSPIVRGA